MSKLAFGVGKNDSDYLVQPQVNGKQICCPYYCVWYNMLRRCYSECSQKRDTTYRGCRVCEEWHLFSVFRKWMVTQDWQGKEIDKDIFGNGKLYSPETCCFIEHWLNTLFINRRRNQGKCPTGVSYHKRDKKFGAQMRMNMSIKHLGYFDTPEKAESVYLAARIEYIVAKMQDYPDQRIKCAVLKKVQNA